MEDQTDSFDVKDFRKLHVLVVGDLMLDRYWVGDADRVSPEAPVPIVVVSGQEYRPGGAANVALNVVSLGAKCTLLGFTGQDEAGEQLRQSLSAAGVNCQFIELQDWRTPVKLRVLANSQQMIRLDFEEQPPQIGESERLALLLNRVEKYLKEAQVLILEDYDKGVLQEPQALITAANLNGVPVLVDPKAKPLSEYKNSDIVKPNEKEFADFVGLEKTGFPEVARRICDELDIKNIIITLGGEGMSINDASISRHIPARPVDVFDVTGAGDTSAAVMGLGLALGISVHQLSELANLASSLVIGKLGTAPISAPELESGLKLMTIGRGVVDKHTLIDMVKEAKESGQRIVFTNGCFDILHAGHVTYLEEAAKLGDRLIVALNKDESVSRLKGLGRPIVKYESRALVISGLGAVDWVVGFDEDTPERLLEEIKPDVLVKGGDYSEERVVGGDFVRGYGGSVNVLTLVEDLSTSEIVDRIKDS
ncbi:MAG: bifunctional D-glycero-beta-D-manno-heptose-7-phosphate kinase/D-glycero-beta-D-manno-heptose 1-phosphate adenylyltransferase HldE [Candidatus Azotimanducaceae bacterium]